MRTLYHIILVATTIMLFSCSDNNSNGDYNSVGSTNTPNDIVGKTLVFKKSNGATYLSVEHYDQSNCFVNNTDVDYVNYPPVYSYKRIGNNGAAYSLEATKVTYIPYYGTNHYSKFSFMIGLTFTSPTSGTYDGIETNAKGEDKTISGTFTLN